MSTATFGKIDGRGYGRSRAFTLDGESGIIIRYRDYWWVQWDADLDGVEVLDVNVMPGAGWAEVLAEAVSKRVAE